MSNLTSGRDDDVVVAEFADQPTSPQRPGRWMIVLVILGMCALVLGPVLTMGLPREASRWNQAAAEEARLNGNDQLAMQKIDRALAWWPENPAAISLRAQWKQEDEDYVGSLADFDRALEIEPGDQQTKLQRSVVLQHLGRHEEAIQTWKSLVDENARANRLVRAQMLNGLAYAQAVGNTELDEALAGIEKALEMAGDSAELLDTRGYIRYLRGDLEAARQDLDAAVAEIEMRLQQRLENRYFVDDREYEAELDMLRHSVAVVVYHRSLVLDALGESEAAERDRVRVRELGFTPDESLF